MHHSCKVKPKKRVLNFVLCLKEYYQRHRSSCINFFLILTYSNEKTHTRGQADHASEKDEIPISMKCISEYAVLCVLTTYLLECLYWTYLKTSQLTCRIQLFWCSSISLCIRLYLQLLKYDWEISTLISIFQLFHT